MAHTLYTAGYTGVSPADLHTATVQLGAILADIRLSPFSRNSDYHKPALIERFNTAYVHIPQLGNLNYKNDLGDGIMLKDVERGTLEVAKLLRVQPVILLCACKHHTTCHRTTAAREMEDRYQVEVIHITGDDIYRMCHPQPPQQLTLF